MEITLTEAKAKLSSMVEKAIAGEEIIVTRMGKPAVKLVPCIETKPKLPLQGLMEGKIKIHGNFDDPWPEDIARSLGIID